MKLADFGLSAAEDPDDDDEGEESGRENSDEVKPKKAVGTPDYLAPEMLLLKPFSFPIDFWAIGVVLFQFLVGETPFYADSAQATYERILHVPPDIPPPEDLSEGSVSLLHALLIKDPAKRLGANGVAEIKAHAFFAPIDWETPLCEQQSPCKPTLHDPKTRPTSRSTPSRASPPTACARSCRPTTPRKWRPTRTTRTTSPGSARRSGSSMRTSSRRSK